MMRTCLVIVLLCCAGNLLAGEKSKMFAIAIHGGAGSSPDKLSAKERAATEASMKKALAIGRDVLAEGGSSLDAVEQVIRFLEDDPLFNAGRGAVYNNREGHQLDASIMDGRDKACGAVAGVTTVRNPISLARLVMTKTRHVLLSGDGADQFAVEMKVPLVDQKYFSTDKAYEKLLRIRREAKESEDEHKGTVGCVALDQHGNLAAGTSTGGLTNKKYGRVGDSPIVGAGTYADNATCAVSCTGIGEEYIRNAIAYDVSARVAYKKQPLPDAVRHVIHTTLRKGDGGIIAVGRDGTIAMDFSTPGMSRGAANSNGLFEVKLGRD